MEPSPRALSWDADRVHTQSSGEVLVAWLTEDDNCERWRRASQYGPETRLDLCEEINNRLYAQRIQHRTNGAIARKILSFKQSVDKTRQLLAENGVRSDTLDHCGSRLRDEVLRLCPGFELLAPVMGAPKKRRSSHQEAKAKTPQPRGSEKLDEAHKFDFLFSSESEEESDAEDSEGPVLAKLSTRSRSKSIDSESEYSMRKQQLISWKSDHVRNKSSLDILLPWITDRSNYARWKCSEGHTRSGPVSRETICNEIKKLLCAHGINHRTNEAIRKKIVSLERSVDRAQTILTQNGLIGTQTLRDCKKRVKKKILQTCPHFELLAAAMVSSRSQGEYKRLKNTQQAKASSAAKSSGNKRKRAIESDEGIQSARVSSKSQIKLEPAPTISSNEVAARRLKTLYELEMEIQEARFRLEREKRKLELDATQRRIQLELCAAQEKQESALIVERALARQKLLDAGISIQEVNLLLPPKRVSL